MKSILTFILATFLLFPLQAQEKVYTVDNLPKVHLQNKMQYVCNPAGILSQAACDSIDSMLYALEQQTGIETVVAVVPSIGEEDCFNFCHQLLRGSIQNVAWMKCKAKYVKPPVHRWLTNVTQYIWEENKKFRSFYFASVASIFIPVDCAVNRGNNERQIEKAKERLYVASVFRLKTKAIRSI